MYESQSTLKTLCEYSFRSLRYSKCSRTRHSSCHMVLLKQSVVALHYGIVPVLHSLQHVHFYLRHKCSPINAKQSVHFKCIEEANSMETIHLVSNLKCTKTISKTIHVQCFFNHPCCFSNILMNSIHMFY